MHARAYLDALVPGPDPALGAARLRALEPYRRSAAEFPGRTYEPDRLDELPWDGSIDEALRWGGPFAWAELVPGGEHLWDTEGNHFLVPLDFPWWRPRPR